MTWATDQLDRIDDAVDDAHREKYGRYPRYVEPMVAAAARATTLRLVPRDAAHRS